MGDLEQAVSLYMQREFAAMATKHGANHSELIETVAAETGIDTAVLTEAILDASIVGPN